MRQEKNSMYRYLLMFGHMFADINQGALPAIIPFLIIQQDLSYASAASLVLAANLVSSFIQPVIGFLGDKKSRPWFMSLGILLAGSGVAFLGFSPSYPVSCSLAALSGIGIAMFHPEGGKIANYVSGAKKGSGMSVFAVGGNLGFAIGPIVTSLALSIWGIKGTIVLLIPAIFMASIMLFFNQKLKGFAPEKSTSKGNEVSNLEKEDDWLSFTKVSSLVFCRSILLYALMTFIPLYLIGQFNLSEAAANINLTVYSLIGVVATLVGGSLADRFGLGKLIKFGFSILAPLIFILIHSGSPILFTILIVPISFAMNCTYGSLIALGQSFVPNRIGLASGISLGLSVSVGGLFAPMIGFIGDKFGLVIAMYAIFGFALLAFLLTFIIPKE